MREREREREREFYFSPFNAQTKSKQLAANTIKEMLILPSQVQLAKLYTATNQISHSETSARSSYYHTEERKM